VAAIKSLVPGVYFYYNAVIMKVNRLLGGFESLLLLAVIRLGDNAYGVSIRRELREKAHRDVAIGAIYTALDRLVRKGYVESRLGEPTAERGGRAKRYYRVSKAGLDVLRETQRSLLELIAGLDFDGGQEYA
jgi:DNA-binding PadR family transcriptional regulator